MTPPSPTLLKIKLQVCSLHTISPCSCFNIISNYYIANIGRFLSCVQCWPVFCVVLNGVKRSDLQYSIALSANHYQVPFASQNWPFSLYNLHRISDYLPILEAETHPADLLSFEMEGREEAALGDLGSLTLTKVEVSQSGEGHHGSWEKCFSV